MSYFDPFPIVEYYFGDETVPSLYQNISAYVDVLDQAADIGAFYQKQPIYDYDRPDSVSFKLYGTVDYHWTFYYLNDNIRRSGWPVSTNRLYELAAQYWPHQTITTKTAIHDTFLPGTVVTGTASGNSGTIVKRDLDLGQMIIDTQGTFLEGEGIQYQDPATFEFINATAYKAQPQYQSAIQYQDPDGNIVDIDPYTQETTALIFVTHLDGLIERNDGLKQINVLRPDIVGQVVGDWKNHLKGLAGG